MDFLTSQYTTGQVIDAARITNDALQSWLRRGIIVGHRDKSPPGKPGIRRQFTFNNVMEISIAKALIDVGVTLENAFKAGSYFAHTGEQSSGWCGETDSKIIRQPGFPFPSPYTLIVNAGSRSEIVRWNPSDDRGQLAVMMGKIGLYRPRVFVTLVTDDVFDQVVTSLGHNPYDLMKEVYKGQ